MSTRRVAATQRTEQPRHRGVPDAAPASAQTQTGRFVPLKDITITWPRFTGTLGADEPTTITGAQLARILDWVTRACPNIEEMVNARSAAIELENLSGVCRALAEGTEDLLPDEVNGAFWTLRDRLSDLSSQVAAALDDGQRYEQATVTIGASAGKAVTP